MAIKIQMCQHVHVKQGHKQLMLKAENGSLTKSGCGENDSGRNTEV